MLRQSSESLPQVLGFNSGAVKRNDDLFTSTHLPNPETHKTYRLDGGSSTALPRVIIPQDYDIDDFFAKVATYYPNRSPISAFVHVLDKEQASICKLPSGKARASLEPTFKRWHLASLGASIGEVVLASNTVSDAPQPAYSACRRTLAFAIARAKSIYPECPTDYVARRWMALRRMSGAEIAPTALEGVQFIHKLLFEEDSSIGIASELLRAVREVAITADDNVALAAAFVRYYPGVQSLGRDLTDGPFDGRAKAFGLIVESIQSTPISPETDSIAAAFYCNQILPGSFSHVRLLSRLSDRFPTALLWYGFFCCLSNEFNIDEFALGLTAKLARDLSESFSFESAPACDISFDEYSILSRLPLKPDAFKPTQPKLALVSLLPGVNVYTRFSNDEEVVSDRDRALVEMEEASVRASMLLEDAISVLRRGSRLANRRPRRLDK